MSDEQNVFLVSYSGVNAEYGIVAIFATEPEAQEWLEKYPKYFGIKCKVEKWKVGTP